MLNKVIIVAVSIFVILSLLVCCGSGRGQAYTYKKYVVCPGDTIWALWEEKGCGKYQVWMDELYFINGYDYGRGLYAGESVLLPVGVGK